MALAEVEARGGEDERQEDDEPVGEGNVSTVVESEVVMRMVIRVILHAGQVPFGVVHA